MRLSLLILLAILPALWGCGVQTCAADETLVDGACEKNPFAATAQSQAVTSPIEGAWLSECVELDLGDSVDTVDVAFIRILNFTVTSFGTTVIMTTNYYSDLTCQSKSFTVREGGAVTLGETDLGDGAMQFDVQYNSGDMSMTAVTVDKRAELNAAVACGISNWGIGSSTNTYDLDGCVVEGEVVPSGNYYNIYKITNDTELTIGIPGRRSTDRPSALDTIVYTKS